MNKHFFYSTGFWLMKHFLLLLRSSGNLIMVSCYYLYFYYFWLVHDKWTGCIKNTWWEPCLWLPWIHPYNWAHLLREPLGCNKRLWRMRLLWQGDSHTCPMWIFFLYIPNVDTFPSRGDNKDRSCTALRSVTCTSVSILT